MRCRDPVKSARSDAERLRRVMVEGTRASDEPVCGAEGQGSTWWSGRLRAVLSHDASFGQDERQNLQPRQDGHQHADARRSGGRGRAPQPEHCQDFRYSPAIFKTGTMARGVAPAALPIKFSRAGGCYVSLPKLCTSAPLQCSQNVFGRCLYCNVDVLAPEL